MSKSSKYWENRSLERLTETEKNSEEYIKRIQRMYDEALKKIEKDLESIYKNYSEQIGVDVQTLKTLLSKKETDKVWKELKKQGLDKYIKKNYKARITRLEQLQAQIYAKAKEIYPKEEMAQRMNYKGVIYDDYYKAIYDTQMGTGYDFSFNKLDDKMVDQMLNVKWSGKNYSERIWGNTDILAQSLSDILGSALLTGQSYARTAKLFRDRFKVSKYYSERLVRTETNYFENEIDAKSYQEMGFDKYVFMAVLDNRTSKVCQEHDNKVFKLKDKEVGINYPPLHPNCRSTTRAYLGKDEEANLVRRARDPVTGKVKTIPNMSYKEWYEQKVKEHGQENVDIAYKKQRNKASDKNQYDRYVKTLGKKDVGSFDDFIKMKYDSNSSEYDLTKYNYKLRNQVIKSPNLSIPKISVDKRKYTKYLFDGHNKNGLQHGKLITNVLGYNSDNYNEFDKLIKENISKYPKIYKKTNDQGELYETNMVVNGLKGRHAKLLVASIKKGDEYFITSAYIVALKKGDLKYD